MKVVVPGGSIGLDFAEAMNDPVSGNRTQWFTYELLDNGEAPKGSLPNVTGGRLEWHANAAVKGGGKITIVSGSRSEIPWLHRRVKIIMHIEGLGEYPLGVFIPSAPIERWDDMNLTLDIELLDKCSIIDNDYVLDTYSVAEGTKVTTAVRNLIESTGENAGSITDSDETLKKALSWESGTSKLQIVNDLLEAANYFSLQVDGNGNYRVQKYRVPRNRATVHHFSDDNAAIYTPEFEYEKDVYSIPNKVVIIAQGDGAEEGMKAVATNENPDSPYSYQSRGRWIVDVVKGVEATSQEALNDRALGRLIQLTSPTGLISINHAPLPWLEVNDVVRFKRTEADIDVRAVVSSTEITLDPMALQRTALQEVAEL
jgi:hypothetical protein